MKLLFRDEEAQSFREFADMVEAWLKEIMPDKSDRCSLGTVSLNFSIEDDQEEFSTQARFGNGQSLMVSARSSCLYRAMVDVFNKSVSIVRGNITQHPSPPAHTLSFPQFSSFSCLEDVLPYQDYV